MKLMICVAALIVFTILALFSAKYRPLAKEAWQCVFLKVRFQPCQSGLDRRVRVAAMLPFMKRTPKFAKWIYKYFSWISSAFVILTIISFIYLAIGGYNYALYGNCNGPGSTGFCIFDPAGPGSTKITQKCIEGAKLPTTPEELIRPTETNLTGFKTFHQDANFTVIFFGCYACPYTREAAGPLWEEIPKRPDVRFIIIDTPVLAHEGSLLAANAGNCAYDANPANYPTYAHELYTADLSQGLPNASIAGYDDNSIKACAANTHPRTTHGQDQSLATGVYGTPTYFIGTRPIVGPLNRRAIDTLIDQEINKQQK